jgi:hypothetical protein
VIGLFLIVIGNGVEWLTAIALGNWNPITSGSPVTQSALLFHDISERETGFESSDARQPGELVLMQTAISVDSRDADREHIVVLPSHEVATDNHSGTPNRCLKSGQHRS